jgi:5-methylcytosine-specific restriction endonuclease McrA
MMILKATGGPVGPPPARPQATMDFTGSPRCDHAVVEVRQDINPHTKKRRYRKQCVRCGNGMGIVGESAVKDFSTLKPFDEELDQRWRKSVSDWYEQRRAEYQSSVESQNAEWWAWYDKYLQTAKWAAIRLAVLERDNRLCRGCHGVATQAHHLTYDRVGNELYCDLISVCKSCHDRLHEHR